MKKRKNLVNKFSSFISFTSNNSQIQLSWNVDFELENSMKSKIKADPDAHEIFWVQYFLKVLLFESQDDNNKLVNLNSESSFAIAKRHLSASLQEACLKAARDMDNEFRYIKHKYSVEEYFQIANIAASSPNKFFKTFNFERNKINIEAYAITAFKRFIRNQIYQQDLEARRTRFSNYGLLKDLSAGELHEALRAQNFSNRQITLYRLAWQCFNEIFQPTSSSGFIKGRSPSQKDFATIASYYNQRCHQLNLTNEPATDTAIKILLSNCINAAKNYRTKQYFGLEENYFRISDPAPSRWDILIQQEEWQQIQIIVDNLFTNMPNLYQIIFKLWQGLNVTQTEIANILKSEYPELQKQYQVARYLKKYTRIILTKFALEWNKINSEVYLDNEKDIEKIKSALEQCLQLYCKQLYFSILDEIIQKFSHQEQEDFFCHINPAINSDLEQEFNAVRTMRTKIIELFQQQIEKSMFLAHNSLFVVQDKIVYFVNEWIENKKNIYDYGEQ